MDKEQSTNTFWHNATVTRDRREELNRHKSVVLWFTGLSGAGKSTVAHTVEEELHQRGIRTMVLDGDNIRHGLCGDLGFSEEARQENIRRIGEVSKLFLEAGVIVLTAFISPFIKDREFARGLVGHGEFIEIFCDTPLSICENRDVKGLYAKARKGEIPHFTGISSPYEPPINPEVIVPTGDESIESCRDRVLAELQARNIILPKEAID